MRRLRVHIVDLITKAPTKALWARVMNANFASIMPQVVATWIEQEGHDVSLMCYTGFEDLFKNSSVRADIVFVSAFTQSAMLAYALSNRYDANGCVTVLGGPHARCYPEDAKKHFDYVLGFTTKSVIQDVLRDCSKYRPLGQYLTAERQPTNLPGVRERWKFIEQILRKAPIIKIVPMIASMGCPYTCGFCVDARVPYQPMDSEQLQDDLRFLLTKHKRPHVAWHDPNFGVRFDECMDAIEDAVPPNSIDFVAESNLALLSESRLKRLQRNGFKAILPGIESWFDMGNKSRTGRRQGMDKMIQISEHVNLILKYIPYVQTNFVLGLESDDSSSFELTKQFVDRVPGMFPGYSLLLSFGTAAPWNLSYQRENRVIPVPFHFLNNSHAMNVRHEHFSWPEFYDHVIDLTKYSFSLRTIGRRFQAAGSHAPRWINLLRAVSSEGWGRLRFYREVRRLLVEDGSFRSFFEGETTVIPTFFIDKIRNDLGPFWEWLPQDAIHHDPNAHLNAQQV